SDPLAVPKTMLEMRRRGYDESFVEKIVYENPVAFMSQCEKFSL
ncbi:MAG: putative metal-dependent TIM-barrel fold hydrolase, partial [Pseudoalteromonas tetraodonis]